MECQNSKTIEPIYKKFGVGDYVGDYSPHDKTRKIANHDAADSTVLQTLYAPQPVTYVAGSQLWTMLQWT